MRALVREAGLEDEIELDSAGTGSWHVGEAPDERATAAARERKLELTGTARQVSPEDFEIFNLMIAMDISNLSALRELAPSEEAREKLWLLREFDPKKSARGDLESLEVPDPYYGGPNGFEEVLDIVERSCRGLLEQIRSGALA
jgi:protein-tyrosine phosphatase